MKVFNCYCCSGKLYHNCCEPILLGIKVPVTAEELMRSRYSAFATQRAQYLVATTHYYTQNNHLEADILEWSEANKWLKLEVLKATKTKVEFKAHYQDACKVKHIHHEFSTFKEENGKWFYVEGQFF